jgi:ketosteroid isomerase-like protein
MKLLRLLPLLLVLGTAGMAVAAGSAVPNPLSRAEQGLRDAEQKRFDAMVAKDADALARALADELTYTHSSGVLQTKAELIKDLTAGSMQYRQITVLEQHFRLHGSIGIINGVVRLSVRMADADREFNVRYTDVYVRRSGRWQLLAWQSTRMAD